MSTLPSVSIVVPVLNGATTLPACLASLRRLDYPSDQLEVIVVDNGSTDDTAALLAREHWIRTEAEPVRGPAAARNRGWRAARGDVIAFTDADCTVDPGWLRALVAPLADRDVGIAGGAILPIEPATPIQRFGAQLHDHQSAIETCRPAYAITMNWASRRELLNTVGGFDPRFLRCEDVDLAYRVQQSGYRVVYTAEAIVYHRNEATLRGLFEEGFLHGWHSVHTLKVHQQYLRQKRKFSINQRSYLEVAASCARALLPRHRPQATCECAFGVGKKFGKIAGSIRYAHVDL